MQSPLFTRAGIRRIERFGISATDGPSRGKRALATTVVSTHPEDNDPAPAQYGKHLADIPLTLRESGRRNCEFSRHRLALAFPALILSDAPIGQQPAFGNDSGMTRDARSPDTAIRLGEIGVSPGSHRPEFPTEPIKPDHASTPLLSDQVRRSKRQNRPKPQAEKYGGFRFQRKTRRRLYPTDKTRPPSARLLPSDRSRDRPLAAEPNSRQPLPGP